MRSILQHSRYAANMIIVYICLSALASCQQFGLGAAAARASWQAPVAPGAEGHSRVPNVHLHAGLLPNQVAHCPMGQAVNDLTNANNRTYLPPVVPFRIASFSAFPWFLPPASGGRTAVRLICTYKLIYRLPSHLSLYSALKALLHCWT